ncbi:MAG: hypothetical protein AVDCRST_MAG83-3286 [uncultured Arthrobacter sp.]|uniref:Uncharacterized protein n=1 Tax=uncultured Arthrobacter sp. TaxID=114050 RepID=A0A6J4J745_9MICC|nr:MAG: hypothetical protein AVDCRST_MAG83-3286 [uncultured Arthrobacter sp.]
MGSGSGKRAPLLVGLGTSPVDGDPRCGVGACPKTRPLSLGRTGREPLVGQSIILAPGLEP